MVVLEILTICTRPLASLLASIRILSVASCFFNLIILIPCSTNSFGPVAVLLSCFHNLARASYNVSSSSSPAPPESKGLSDASTIGGASSPIPPSGAGVPFADAEGTGVIDTDSILVAGGFHENPLKAEPGVGPEPEPELGPGVDADITDFVPNPKLDGETLAVDELLLTRLAALLLLLPDAKENPVLVLGLKAFGEVLTVPNEKPAPALGEPDDPNEIVLGGVGGITLVIVDDVPDSVGIDDEKEEEEEEAGTPKEKPAKVLGGTTLFWSFCSSSGTVSTCLSGLG